MERAILQVIYTSGTYILGYINSCINWVATLIVSILVLLHTEKHTRQPEITKQTPAHLRFDSLSSKKGYFFSFKIIY